MWIIRLFLSAALLLGAFAHGQDVFVSKPWSFSIDVPEDWVRLSEARTMQNLEVLDLDDSTIAAMIAEHRGNVLVLSLSKRDPKTAVGLIPTIKVTALQASGSSASKFYSWYSQAVLTKLRELFSDARVGTLFTQRTIGGVECFDGVILYSLPMSREVYEVRLRLIVAFRKNHYLQFAFLDSDSEDETALFDRLIASLKFL